MLALVAAVGLVATACGDDSPSADTSAEQPVLAIDGATYLSESATGYTLVDGSVLTLSFDGDRLSANAGCNTMSGGFAVTDGALVLDGPMAATQMFCDGLMDQETWFSDFLAASPLITQDGDRITLASDDVTLVMLDREVADPDRPLEGTNWLGTSLIRNEAVSTVPEGASLMFDNGEVAVNAGCNTGGASYELSEDGTEVTFGPLRLTKMACTDDDSSALESAMIEVLTGTATIEIDADSLTLTNGATGIGFTAEK